jgi:hypothetical protein
MATNGILKFQGTNKATFVGATSNVVIDTVKSSLGIGVDVDGPTSNLHVVGNAYVSTELTVGGTVTAAGFAGNATTASALAASVNIGGVAFDGSAAIVPTTFNGAAFNGDVTVASSKFSFDTNGTSKQEALDGNGRYIKLMKYFGNASNWKIATGSYSTNAWQWINMRVKMARLDGDVKTIQFNFHGNSGSYRVTEPMIIGTSASNEVKVYVNTSTQTYEIYIQNTSAVTVEVEIYHRASTIDDDYSTVAAGAIVETGLAKIYDSSTTTDFIVKSGNVGIGTTSPDNKLEIADHTSTNPTLLKLTCETAASPGESNTAIQLSGTSGGGYGGYIEGYLEQGVGSGLKLGHINSSQVKTEYMRIIDSGNVGIGVTDPQRSLHVKSTSGMMIEDNATTSAIYVDNVAQGETGEVYSYILNAPRPGTTGSGATHFINGSGRTGDGGASTYTIRNDSGKLRLGGTSGDTIIEGNVGIGVTDPVSSAKLDVRGNGMIFDKAKGDGTILTGLYNWGDTQSMFIDMGVSGGVGTVTASTIHSPPPGTAGDVICAFQNSTGGEAVTSPFNPGTITGQNGDVFTFSLWTLATQNINMEFFINPGGTGGASAAFTVLGDGNWHFHQVSLTMTQTSNMFFRIDNNSGGRLVYVTGVALRKNATSGVDLPFTPRYSPHDGIGSVFATQNIVAKEAAIRTLTGNVGIGTTDPQGALHVAGNSGPSNTSKALGIHMGVHASSYAHMELVCSGSFSGWIDFKNANTSGNGDYEERIRGGDGNLEFHTNKAQRMKIDSSGKVNFSHTEKFNLFYAPTAWGYSTTTVAAHVNLWTFDVVIPQEGYLIASVNGHWNHSTAGHYVYVSIGVDGDDPADTSGFYDNYTVGGAGTQGGNFHSYKDSSVSWQDVNWSGTFKVAAGTRTISLRMFSQSGTAYVNGAAIKLMYIPKYYF